MPSPGLSETEFKGTFGSPMTRVSGGEAPPFDFWPYVGALSQEEYEGYDCSEGTVEYVYREPSGRFEHVLINSDDKNVFMVIVLDRIALTVHGHRLLNLATEYGLESRNRSQQHGH